MESPHSPDEPRRVDADDPIARVLKFAGARPQPDPERKAAFKTALHAEWRRATTPRAVTWAAAIAAGIAAVLLVMWGLPWRGTPPPAAKPVVARVVRSEGTVRAMQGSAAPSHALGVSSGEDVRADTALETAETGRMALELGTGISLRIDVASRIVLVGERVLNVERGAVYVDSGVDKRQSVVIRTPLGDIRDIGTQFEVRAEPSAVRVRVREGEILVNRSGSEMTARAGESLRVDQHGRYLRSTIPIFGPEWAWTSEIAPQFQLEGRTVREFLDWVARELGWRWRFADRDTARRAAGIVTHGSLEGYTPEEALSIVLPTCGLSFVRHEDEILVSLVKEPRK